MTSSDNTYKILELVGSSSEGVQEAIDNAISRANQTIRHLDWFEVREIRGNISDGRVAWYQVKLGIGFRVVDAEDVNRE